MSERLLILLLAICLSAAAAATEAEPLADGNAVAEQTAEPTFADFFASGIIRHATLSPSGHYVAYLSDRRLMVGNAELGYFSVWTFGSIRVRDLSWSSDNVLIASLRSSRSGESSIFAMEIDVVDGEPVIQRHNQHIADGFIWDLLSDEDEWVIFARVREHDETVATDLFRIDLFGDTFPQFRSSRRLNRGTDHIFYFLPNPGENFVLGIGFQDRRPQLWSRPKGRGRWDNIWSAPVEATFEPMRASADNKIVWALSDIDTDRVAAVAFDVDSAQISEVLFEHPRNDVHSILFSDDGEPIGVSYFSEGVLRYEFFAEEGLDYVSPLEARFPDEGVVVTGSSDDDQRLLAYVSSPQNPGEIHLCDLASDDCSMVAETRPWLANVRLAETTAMQVESTDDLIIDTFLTMPADAGPSVPLIAMPHGGPIGVSDNQYYSGDVQWLAHNGYAVLQVNYRGSSGYGRAFLTAGLREWGRGIEEDVEAAVEHALREYPMLDRNRVGIYGSSYGGYSALMSVLERPDLFQCAAAFAGVTDLTLLFNRPEVRHNEQLRRVLVDMVGDPDIDYEELVEYSPVYRYEEFSRPLFIAHGNSDSIVDVEHSWRLRIMLNLAGKRPEFVVIDNVGHGFDYVQEAAELYDPLIEFLDRHLKPDEQAVEESAKAGEETP
ncbi:MAG: prolyl oligopeptidase family serine peptidase [Woeseiaceae bacterium]|nr:prolyl oligopeptidase family serine peptidase [Woeseiaceae bacterium]